MRYPADGRLDGLWPVWGNLDDVGWNIAAHSGHCETRTAQARPRLGRPSASEESMMWDATPMILAAVRNGRFTGLPLASSSETRRAAQSAF